MSEAATALQRMYERNASAIEEVLLEMPHWEFNADSPLLGDRRHFGTVDFRLERMGLSQRDIAKLTLGFFTTGIVGFSKKGGGWLFFSSGSKGRPELAAATPQQVKTLPRLPDNWEDVAIVMES